MGLQARAAPHARQGEGEGWQHVRVANPETQAPNPDACRRNNVVKHKMDHLSCFIPAMLALGAHHRAVPPDKAARYLQVPADLEFRPSTLETLQVTPARGRCACRCPSRGGRVARMRHGCKPDLSARTQECWRSRCCLHRRWQRS